MSTETEIAALVAETLRVRREQVTGDALLVHDLGADSMDSISLMMAVEDEFGIDIPDEDAEEIRTVRQLMDYVTFAIAAAELRGRAHLR